MNSGAVSMAIMKPSMPTIRQGCSEMSPPMTPEPTSAKSVVARSSSARVRSRADLRRVGSGQR